MLKSFEIDRKTARLVNKSTFFSVLKYIDTRTIETPCLVVDRDKVKDNISLIGSNIEQSKVFYAVKANPDVEVLRLLHALGTGFEIASEGELRILSEIEVEPEKIISSNPVKSLRFIKDAAHYGVRYFAYDSYAEIEKLSDLVPDCNVYVRLSVPNEGSEWPLSKKFGVEIDEALSLMLKARERGLNPVGITFHVGSQCMNLYNWNIAIDKARFLWQMAEKAGIVLSLLNIGGGYPVKYTKSVLTIENIESTINSLIRERFPRDTEIHLEPGRAVIGDAGILVARIIGKAMRSNENWLYIDTGVFNGLMESIGGIRYTYLIEKSKNSGEKKSWTIAGPSCDSFDVIDKNIVIHEPQVGDLVLILSGGAYTISYASEFNGFSIPETVIL